MKNKWNATISRDESGNKTGMNGTLSWNENGTDLWVEGNAYSELAKSPVTDMGHEFSHAFDDMTMKGGPIVDPIDELPRHEWAAVYRENEMRGELKLPYRTHYNTGKHPITGVLQPLAPYMLKNGRPYMPISYPNIK
jgi:hypothetical protein